MVKVAGFPTAWVPCRKKCMDKVHQEDHFCFPSDVIGKINEPLLSHYTYLGLNVTAVTVYQSCIPGRTKGNEQKEKPAASGQFMKVF